MKPVYVLFFLAIAAPMLALLTGDQDPETTDWSKAVENAATSRRYGLRLAAAKKIAAAGAAAVPAIADYAAKNGRNALPLPLVDAIAREDSLEAAVVDQLLEWTGDRDFYWRPQAFYGLARRAPALPDRRGELEALFTAHRDDPAWMVATYSRFGLHQLGGGDTSARPTDDPRLTAKLTALLLESGRRPPLQPLLDALADERTFLGVPWAQRHAGDAHRALKEALGEAHPGAFEDKREALTAMREAIRQHLGQELEVPELVTDSVSGITGGIEVLSCRNGDLFVQWTDDGRIYEGIDARFCVQLPAPTWDELSSQRTALPLESNLGVVICDKMRLKWDQPELHIDVAPGELPQPAAEWFEKLAKALQEADKDHLAAAIRAMVEQFAAR